MWKVFVSREHGAFFCHRYSEMSEKFIYFLKKQNSPIAYRQREPPQKIPKRFSCQLPFFLPFPPTICL